METPKKPVKKDSSARSASVKRPDEKPADVPAKKKIIDDDDDEDFDMPLDDLGRYENFDTYDDDDDY
ncbi:hypothetical protein [Mucilaginibacter sp.]|jgi:hypothetical protein|uniref:hypothetical protein n=1 Tax=Mucilaginibacter sp. TaxID=1882438 RepID=UPI002C48D2DE|nr:hypothetical protein [Mucilaginibacter sp.]HTI59455.1 hypothetical protein [Mucilaginibacter sp.]